MSYEVGDLVRRDDGMLGRVVAVSETHVAVEYHHIDAGLVRAEHSRLGMEQRWIPEEIFRARIAEQRAVAEELVGKFVAHESGIFDLVVEAVPPGDDVYFWRVRTADGHVLLASAGAFHAMPEGTERVWAMGAEAVVGVLKTIVAMSAIAGCSVEQSIALAMALLKRALRELTKPEGAVKLEEDSEDVAG